MKKDTKDTLRVVFSKVTNLIKTLILLVFLVLTWMAYSRYSQQGYSTTSGSFSSSPWECSGKTTCAEMESCAEAKFYMRNCPGTDLDPDGDGVPCENSVCKND